MTARSRTSQRSGSARRALRPAGGALLVAMLAITGCAAPGEPLPGARATPAPSSPAAADSGPRATDPAAAPSAPPMPAAGATALAPASVTVASMGLSEPLIELGIAPEGDMEVPVYYDEVGWFTGGGRPGGHGPTVIAGHVDSPTGPGVFHRLHELVEGDAVEVADAAGTVLRYVVTEVADYEKADFPTGRVFGATAADELRLITCGGFFDAESAAYLENRVVYAVRAAD